MAAINGVESVGKLLQGFAQMAQARTRAEEAPQPETLVEQLAPEPMEEPAAEITEVAEEPAAKVELSEQYKAVQEMQQNMGRFEEDLESAQKQGEAMAESMENFGKILAIFRRISKGDIVPARDEHKLMEHDPKLYNMAKQLGAMAKNEDPKKHRSVDSEEEQKAEMQQKVAALSRGAAEAPAVEMPAAAAPAAPAAPAEVSL